MIYYKTEEEIELIRESCLMVCKTLAYAGSLLKPGITGAEIDTKAEQFIRDHDGIPGFKGYGGFPGTLCISINEQVVHGIPSDIEFKDGDIVSLDCGVIMNGYNGDAAYTFAIGDVNEETMKLLRVTRESLYRGIEKAVKGNRIGDIGWAIQDFAEKQEGYGIVRELVGHGIGKSLHEDPEVPNFGRRGRGILMKENLVIAIEPMVNLKTKNVVQEKDGWTIRTKDKQPSAHYEHTVVVKKNKAEILSDHSFIEEMIKTNQELKQV